MKELKTKKQTSGNYLLRMISAAMCLTLCMLLPFLTGQIPEIGSMLCPMHIPVLLAGFICGPWWALIVGFIAPLLRFVLFQMPPIFPVGIAMSFELAAYGLVSGLFYAKLPAKNWSIYASLIAAMISGRLVWGATRFLLTFIGDSAFGLSAFIAGAFTTAIPGIILHIVLIPLLVIALQKAGLIKR